jgi:hypothetical protein
MAAYRQRMARFPVKLPLGPQTELCSMVEELRLDVKVPPPQTQPRNSWILAPTWALINKRATLQHQGRLSQLASCLIGRQIKAGLSRDWQQRAATATENIEMHLAGGETKEAWRCLKGWYQAASERAPAASHVSLAVQTGKCVVLYGKVPPPGENVPIHVDKVVIPDSAPSDQELREVVRELRNSRAAGATGLKAEHIKVWLRNVVREEEEGEAEGPIKDGPPTQEEGESDKGKGRKWCIFVGLMQAVWEHGSLPKQMKWVIIVLLPKGGSDYRGIGLLEPFWKVIEKIMVARLSSVNFTP